MVARLAMWLLVLSLVAAIPAGIALADEREPIAKRDDEFSEVGTFDDDDGDGDDDSKSNYTSGNDSNDKTGSGYTSVSRDRDRSRGDKTRDWTKDGGSRTRDRSAHRTNDRSRNDTR